MFIIIPMFMFLKSFNGEDKNICGSFLPEIIDTAHPLNKKYQNIKTILFSISKKLVSKKNKICDKENRTWNKSKVYNKGFKSLLNSAKFLSGKYGVMKNNKMDKELFALSRSNDIK